MSSTELDDTLISYGTPRQQEVAKAVAKYGTREQAAIALGMTSAGVRSTLSDLRRRAARMGWAPEHDMTKPAPEGFHIKGTSTLYGEDGSIRAQWVKTNKDQEEKTEALLDAIRELAEPFRGTSEVPPPPKGREEDLLCLMPWGDPHFGLYAHAAECGENFDLKIAERNLVTAVDQLVEMAPRAAHCLIVNLGDFFHADTYDNKTPKSGHALDVDTRWHKVLSVGIRGCRRAIDRSLEKFGEVTFESVPGNHDPQTSLALALALSLYYENNPRVHIDISPSPLRYFRWGKNLFFMNHGDKIKPQEMPMVMAADRPKDWGETRYRYALRGHIHHESVKEYPGVVVESFRTLAAKDAYHHAHGYRADRDARLDVYHKEDGYRRRYIVGIEQIRSAA